MLQIRLINMGHSQSCQIRFDQCSNKCLYGGVHYFLLLSLSLLSLLLLLLRMKCSLSNKISNNAQIRYRIELNVYMRQYVYVSVSKCSNNKKPTDKILHTHVFRKINSIGHLSRLSSLWSILIPHIHNFDNIMIIITIIMDKKTVNENIINLNS